MSASRKPSLHDLSRLLPTANELEDIITKIDEAEPRAAALVLSSLVDGLLEIAIDLNFIALGKDKHVAIFRDRAAPLSSFSAKIIIAHAMGIIDSEFASQLDKLRTIRNAFAHAVKQIDFDNEAVAAGCQKLSPQRLMKATYQPETDSPRERFTVVGTFAARHLIEYCLFRTRKIKDGSWPLPSPFRGKFG
jgi:hypothetical protein